MEHIDFFPATLRERRPAQLSEAPSIDPSARLVDCALGDWTEIGPRVTMLESSFDAYSYLAGDNQIVYSSIGRFCSIASHVRINPGNHPMERVTQHHMTYRRAMYGFAESNDEAFFQWRREHRCTVGHDVWLGHGAIVMPGVHVGTGAVVGAGAVVTHNVAPYMIVAGVPARPIRQRFPDTVAEQLLAIAWWEWDRPTLAARFHELNDVASFVEKYADARH